MGGYLKIIGLLGHSDTRSLELYVRKMVNHQLFMRIILDVLRTYSPTGEEDCLRKQLIAALKKMGVFRRFCVKDIKGNIVATRGRSKEGGKIPLICTHMDTVRNTDPENQERYMPIPKDITINKLMKDKPPKKGVYTDGRKEENPKYFKYIEAAFKDYQLVPGVHYLWLENRYLGFDDKAGIAMALYIARKTKCPLCLLFTRGEENSRSGIKMIPAKEYDGISYVISIDRHGSRDLVTAYADFDSEESKLFSFSRCSSLNIQHYFVMIGMSYPSRNLSAPYGE